MTHILVMTEGFPEGIEQMMRDVKELNYPLRTGAEYEIGGNAQPDIREVRLWDIVVKDDIKERFLADLKPCSTLSIIDVENPEERIPHGENGGFKVGLFRKMLQMVFGFVGAKPIDMKKIKANEEKTLLKIMEKNNSAWHGYIMVIGELRDGFETIGPNKGREHS